jgi:phenylacetate-CoA ligase
MESMLSLRKEIRLKVLRKRYIEELEKSQWFPPKKLQQLQTRRLRTLIEHSYDSVPYYRKIFDERGLKPEDIRTPEDITKLPVLNKEDIRNNLQEMMSTKYKLDELEEVKTSGSTSIPLIAYKNKDIKPYRYALRVRFLNWLKIEEYPITAYFGPPTENYSLNVPKPISLNTWDITEGKLEKFTENIRKFEPKVLRGYPSSLSLLTKFCEKRRINDLSFNCIISTGEKLFEKEKERMERTFKTEVYQFYSTMETGNVGYDCPFHAGLHVHKDILLVEFLKNGEPAEAGEVASVVVTPLMNLGMPLIRYDFQDAAYWIDEPCHCGRSLPLMSYVDGRITDILVAPDGRWLGDSNFHSRIFEHVDVKQYRIIQETVTDLTVKLIPGKKYDKSAERFIVKSIKKHMGEQVEVTVKKTDEIETSPSRKRRVVISHVTKNPK